MTRRYDASAIEPGWVARWEEEHLFEAVDDPADTRPRFYALDMFPYPSGDLHMGHAEAFSGGDVVARYRAMRGDNGRLYTLTGNAGGYPPGTHVRVTGTLAQQSFCQQGTTISVRTITRG